MAYVVRKLRAKRKPDSDVHHLRLRASFDHGETLDAQLAQLKAAGAIKVFREKVSGARADRPELARLLRSLAPGDRVIVTRLDRLARSTRDLLNTLAAIAECKATFRSLGDLWADTTTPHGRLMLTVLGGLAEFERELIRARTGEGRERAKARRSPPWTQAEAERAPTARGAEPTRCRRGTYRNRAHLQRASFDYFTT